MCVAASQVQHRVAVPDVIAWFINLVRVVPDLSECVLQVVPRQGAPAEYSAGSLFLPGII